MKKIIFLFTILFCSAVWARSDSVYTKVSKETCYFNSNSAEGDLDIGCPGKGGYQIRIIGNDNRDFLSVIYQGMSTQGYYTTQLGFNIYPGDTLEWRFQTRGNKKRFYALIYRVYFQSFGSNKKTSKLAVIRLNGENSCLLGMIPASKNMNVKARELADDLLAECQY